MQPYGITPPSVKQAINDEPYRFVDLAFRENSNIKDFGEFKTALFNAFGDENGERITKFLNDDELKFLFESDACREKIQVNVGYEEYNKIYGELKRGEIEAERELPKGIAIKGKQVKIIHIKKDITKKAHTRANKPIPSYSSGYMRWKPQQENFLRQQKVKKISLTQTIYKYNSEFKTEQRTKKSIKSKYYRI